MRAHSWVGSDPAPVLWAIASSSIIQGISQLQLELKEEEMDFYQDSESVHSARGIPVDLEGFPGSRKGKKRKQMNKGMTTSKHIKCLKEWKGALGG